jgi:hypothetical protein
MTPKKPVTRSDDAQTKASDPVLAATTPTPDTTTSLPFDEADVAVRVAAGELVRLNIEGNVPVRLAVLAQLRANASRPRGGGSHA